MKKKTFTHLGAVLLLIIGIGVVYPLRAAAESDSAQESEEERPEVSFYLLDKRGFMESGAYEEYLEMFINTDNPPVQNKEQDRTDDQPQIYLEFMGMDETISIFRPDPKEVYHNRAFFSSLFYMEIPEEWFVGATASCPFVFCHESDREPESLTGSGYKEYQEVFPGKSILNKNAENEIAEFIREGGINGVLEDALGQPITDAYEIEQDEPGGSYYSVKKDGKNVANVLVWVNIGQVGVWLSDPQVKYVASEDYGRVYVFEEWADQDFSTPEAIRDYMESGKADHLLEPVLGTGGSWSYSEFSTEYHDFLRFDGGNEKLMATCYIPVTADYNENFLLLFEASKRTEVPENAYHVQERIMKTFLLHPYYYTVEKGDNISAISKRFTDDPDNYSEIAEFKPNQSSVVNSDRIYPGQKISIPLSLLFDKIHYQ